MAYLQSDEGLPQHPKTYKVMTILGIPKPAVIGSLEILWAWAFRNAPDGLLPNDEDCIDQIADCTRDTLTRIYRRPKTTPSFTKALITAGFLDRVENGLKIHNFEERVGKIIEKLQADAQRKRDDRAQKALNRQEKPADKPEDVTQDVHSDIRRTSIGHPADVQALSAPFNLQPLAFSNPESIDQKIEEEITHTHADKTGKSEPDHLEEPKKTPATKTTNGAILSVIQAELQQIAEIYPNCPRAQGVNTAYLKARNSPDFPGIDQLIETIRWQLAQPTWQPGYEGRPYGFTPQLENYLSKGRYTEQKPPEAEPTKPIQHKKSTYTDPDTGLVYTAKPVEQTVAELRSRA